MTYNEKVKTLTEKYEPRIRALLARYGEAFRAAGYGWDGEIWAEADEEYRWQVTLLRPGTEQDEESGRPPDDAVDVTFIVCEEKEYDDADGEGVTFRLDLTEVGGRILGGQAPYNYTPKCWLPLDDEDEIEARFRLFEAADFASAVKVAEEAV